MKHDMLTIEADVSVYMELGVAKCRASEVCENDEHTDVLLFNRADGYAG